MSDRGLLSELSKQLNVGEAEAIVLANELAAELLIIDEKRDRTIAEQRGLRCLGFAILIC